MQRLFLRQVGVSPKLLCRIVRFQRIFAAWRADPSSLARVALECGYFDQSHLVRDFHDFAGAPPAGFLAELPAFTRLFLAT
jgi:transcriptional regulator GlxA family with amidase domain